MENKEIECWMVRVARISDKGNCTSMMDARLRIECGRWVFPCPSYSYAVIRERLKEAICSVLGIREVEIKSFATPVVEYP